MRNLPQKLICILLAALAFVGAVFFRAFGAAGSADYREMARQGLLAGDFYSADSLQDLLDGYCTDKAGGVSEYTVMTLLQLGESLDFSAYAAVEAQKLRDYTGPNNTKLKICLTAWAAGGIGDEEALEIARNGKGRQGIVSYIYPLFIASNVGDEPLAAECAEYIVSQQSADGGWGLSTDKPSADMTAMAMQSLAGIKDASGVSEALERGVSYLASIQLESGGFDSFGSENAESSAQVIIALSTLGIDPDADERFLRGENSPVKALLEYRLTTGSFEHVKGQNANLAAFNQALMALTALARLRDGEKPFFSFARQSGQAITPAGSWHIGRRDIQLIVGVVVFAAAAAVVIIRIKKKKITVPEGALLLAIAAGISCFIIFSTFETPGEYYDRNLPEITENSRTAMLTIDKNGETVLGGEYVILDGDTVFALLVRAAGAAGISMDYTSGTSAYISSIDGLGEGDMGPYSGWMYSVNGIAPGVSCGAYDLQDGDIVLFYYVEDYRE